MTLLAAALCADQWVVVEGAMRAQAVADVFGRLTGCISRAEQRQQPSATRLTTKFPRPLAASRQAPLASLCHVHPADIPHAELRLPPPTA